VELPVQVINVGIVMERRNAVDCLRVKIMGGEDYE